MAQPTSRTEFESLCLRQLGHGVIKVNVSEEQITDCVDIALKKFSDYHYEASEYTFFKYVVETGNEPDKVYRCTINSGGSGYANGEALVFSADKGTGAAATVTTNGSGSITGITISNHGDKYPLAPSVTVNTALGTGASITAELGGWVPVPENVMGVVDLFDLGSETGVNNIFNIRYQIALNDLYTLTSVSMVPFYVAMQHIQFLEQILVGKTPLRYNKYKNRLYIDEDWSVRLKPGVVICAKGYEVIDPAVYTKIWQDHWLQKYSIALIKRVWGMNMSKFQGLPGPGGVMLNGQKIYNDAVAEIDKLDEELIMSWSLPPTVLVG